MNVAAELDKVLLRLRRFARSRHTAKAALDANNETTSLNPPRFDEAGILMPFPDVRAVGSVPRGLYIWGPVGTGKTMLMDLLHSELTQEEDMQNAIRIPARRVHFHAFMLEVHLRIHEWKKASLVRDGRSMHIDTRPERDAIVHVARQIAAESWCLCFDEFQVTDIADALIISRLFRVLWSNGVVMVATSNRPPADLYENGLNRHYFTPFIDTLIAHAKTVHLDSGTDYRTEGAQAAAGAFIAPPGPDSAAQLLAAARSLAPGAALSLVSALESLPYTTLPVPMGRTLHVRMLAPGVAVASFAELCARPVAAADYLSLTSHVTSLLLTDIPILSRVQHNEARRFITLVDQLYEAGTHIVCTAQAGLPEIFKPLLRRKVGAASAFPPVSILAADAATESSGTAYHDGRSDPAQGEDVEVEVEEEESEGAMLNTEPGSRHRSGPSCGAPASMMASAAEVAALGELTFAARRALSRLTEMTSIKGRAEGYRGAGARAARENSQA